MLSLRFIYQEIPSLFDHNIFAYHDLPLAAYVEVDGFARLSTFTRPQERHYTEFVPATYAAAKALFTSITQKREWGAQYVTKEQKGIRGGGWKTENVAHKYSAGNSKSRRGKELAPRDVLRSLTRSDVYAIGRTDRHIIDLEHGPFGNSDWCTTSVSVLCLDVDMDRAWANEDLVAVRRELVIESHLAAALGLPYRVFRTGGRGHQAVFPLPVPIDRSVAAWLLDAYLHLLVPYHNQGNNEAKADASNLQGIVRVAGGRHAKTDRAALWIDPITATLYPIESQLEMMHSGYHHPQKGTSVGNAFADAASELADFLEGKCYLLPHEYGSAFSRELGFWAAVEHLPENLLVERFRAAQEKWELAGEDDPCEDKRRVKWGNRDTQAMESVQGARSGQRAESDAGTRAWAERVWAIDWPEHNLFWQWANEGGQRGITAAKILFGEEGDYALNAMLARVDEHPISISDPVKARDRKRTLRSFFQKHIMLPFHHHSGSVNISSDAFDHARALAVRELSSEGAALVPEVLKCLRGVKPIQERCIHDIEHIIEIILLGFEAHSEWQQINASEDHTCRDYVELSLNDFVVIAEARWPNDAILDRSTVARHLKRLIKGAAGCGYALIAEVPQSKDRTLSTARYRAGADVLASTFASKLSPTLIVREKMCYSTSPLSPLVIRARGGICHQPSTTKRGRKRRDTSVNV